MSTTDEDPIEVLATAIERLKISYEKYFAGIDRREPTKARANVRRLMQQLRSAPPITNTARRFKLQTLQATLVVHEAHWNKLCRQIEEGTLQRDRARAKKLLDADIERDVE